MLLVWVMKPEFSVTRLQAMGYQRERLPLLKLKMKEGFVRHVESEFRKYSEHIGYS